MELSSFSEFLSALPRHRTATAALAFLYSSRRSHPMSDVSVQNSVRTGEYTDTASFQPAGFRPFIPPEVTIPELTALPLIAGTVLGMIFGASSLYLVLKVGLTVSAS